MGRLTVYVDFYKNINIVACMQYHYLPEHSYPHFIEIDKVFDLYSSSGRVFREKNFSHEEDYVNDILKRPLYEWLLETVGPSDDMIWDTDRLYFNKEDCPEIPRSREEWLSKRIFLFGNPNKWLLCSANSSIVLSTTPITGLAFKQKDSAMLFKLTWG